MSKNYQYYANRNLYENSNIGEENDLSVCPTSRQRQFDYLLKNNYLSEYSDEESQYEVLYNLGLLQKLDNLKKIIDSKVIQKQGVIWDDVPTEGNSDHVLSSDALKQEFLKYYTKTKIDDLIQQIWNNILDRIPDIDSELSETSENPVQNKILKEILDNKVNNSQLEELLSHYIKQEDINNILDNLDGIEQLQESINSEISRAQNSEQSLSERISELESGPSDNIKHVILTQEDYDKISTPEHNVLYIIIESTESKFGDPFPFILK